MSAPDINNTVAIKRNNIYLPADVYHTYFSGIETVILLKETDTIIVMPIQGTMYGGLLLKIINSQGDRVVSAYDFLKFNGLSDLELSGDCYWNKDKMGLAIPLPQL